MSSSCIVLNPVHEDAVLSRIATVDGFPESILIYLSVPGTSVIPMRVLDSESVSSVKLRIQSFGGFIMKKQKLVFGGRELARNNSLVRDYGVADGNVLHLMIRLSDVRFIAVETTCGKKLQFHVERFRNIKYVKQRIAKEGKCFLDLDDHELICDGEELDDEQLVDEISKENDAVIHLLVSKSCKVRYTPIDKEFELSVEQGTEIEEESVDSLQAVRRKTTSSCINPIAVNSEVSLPQVITDLIHAAFDGLENGNPPIMSTEGSGGAYFLQDRSGHDYVAVFKPIDEEPMAENNPRGLPLSVDGEGLKRGTRVGEGAFREVAAYILDHPATGRRSSVGSEMGFSGVPPTAMVRCLHEGFNHPGGYHHMEENIKIGSLQMFVKNYGSCEDMGPRAFPVEEVHKIAVLDIRLANADRHAGNILICMEEKDGRIVLVPIDHGYCLPENFEDCTFEWLYWPQSSVPFSPETVDYIRSLDAEEDIALLKLHGWRLSDECARTLHVSTMLLKKGVERGLTPRAIGSVLCRETLKKESLIEEIVREAGDAVLPGTGEAVFLECISDVMDRRLDEITVM